MIMRRFSAGLLALGMTYSWASMAVADEGFRIRLPPGTNCFTREAPDDLYVGKVAKPWQLLYVQWTEVTLENGAQIESQGELQVIKMPPSGSIQHGLVMDALMFVEPAWAVYLADTTGKYAFQHIAHGDTPTYGRFKICFLNQVADPESLP